MIKPGRPGEEIGIDFLFGVAAKRRAHACDTSRRKSSAAPTRSPKGSSPSATTAAVPRTSSVRPGRERAGATSSTPMDFSTPAASPSCTLPRRASRTCSGGWPRASSERRPWSPDGAPAHLVDEGATTEALAGECGCPEVPLARENGRVQRWCHRKRRRGQRSVTLQIARRSGSQKRAAFWPVVDRFPVLETICRRPGRNARRCAREQFRMPLGCSTRRLTFRSPGTQWSPARIPRRSTRVPSAALPFRWH